MAEAAYSQDVATDQGLDQASVSKQRAERRLFAEQQNLISNSEPLHLGDMYGERDEAMEVQQSDDTNFQEQPSVQEQKEDCIVTQETSIVEESDLHKFDRKNYTQFQLSKTAKPLPAAITQSWFPRMEDLSGPLAKRLATAWQVIQQDRGQTQAPKLVGDLERTDICIDDLPWASFASEDWETLFVAYAINDFRCPIEACEPKGRSEQAGGREDFPRPFIRFLDLTF